jgi:hypothetical protein
VSDDGRLRADGLPARRVVILGASNLVRGIATVFETSARCWGVPLDFLAAHGHGRSYGGESMFLGRVLPGIKNCALWEVLAERPPAPTAALLTDIGNDILYNARVERIVEWVELCLERLRPQCERIVVTDLPVHQVHALTRQRYNFIRSIIFPQCSVPFEQAVDGALRLNEAVCDLADRFGATRVTPRPEWYGFDPIHVRFDRLGPAWREILTPWCDGEPPAIRRISVRRALLLRRLRPHYRRVFGFEQRQVQPAARLRDGSLISYY